MYPFHKDFEWIVFDNPNIINLEIINECDIILLDITENNLDYYLSLITNAIIVLRIHNMNFWLKNKISFKESFNFFLNKEVLKRLTKKEFLTFFRTLYPRFFSSKYLIRSKLLSKINFLTFCDQSQFDYYKMLCLNFKTLQFPSSYYVGDLLSKLNCDDTLRIVVAGEISAKRRDYEIIGNAISKINSKELKIDLIILGNGGTKEAYDIIKSISHCSVNCNLITFNQFINQDDYSAIINKSHILLNPLPSQTIYCGSIENYGFSKTSGSYGDFLRYGLIPIFPSFYPIPSEYKGICEQYDNVHDLIDILEYFTVKDRIKKRLVEIDTKLFELNLVSIYNLNLSLKKLITSYV